MPYVLNAVTPSISTGFDLGVELHGVVNNKFGYEVGLFNGTGAAVNSATKTFSDDWHIPSLLYAGRLTYMPWGTMPSTQGNPNMLHEKKMLVGLSGSMNVESENESTNDARMGLEFAMLLHRWYFAAEAYWMNVGFTKRQKISEHYNYLGGYLQGGYFITPQVQLAARYDFMNRNSTSKDGFLNMPAVGVNYFFKTVTSSSKVCINTRAERDTPHNSTATTTTSVSPRILPPCSCNIISNPTPTTCI